jgi:hypothetical protein
MAEPATTIELPALTRDLDRALEDMREFGVARIEGVLQGTILARVRDALYRAAASDRERGWNTRFVGAGDAQSANLPRSADLVG